jgi:hypothetical protein
MPKLTPGGKKTAVADVGSDKQLSLRLSVPAVEVAWAAGFWEGEGSVAEKVANASQVNIWPLRRLKKLFGGTISTNARRDPRRLDVSQPIWQWHISGPRGRDFMEAIYPYLSPRRQAQIDDKFITWEKFRLRRAVLGPAQAEQAGATIERIGRDPVTGRFGRAS